jgi:hypothetical protein
MISGVKGIFTMHRKNNRRCKKKFTNKLFNWNKSNRKNNFYLK